jgi:DNA polymerase-1
MRPTPGYGFLRYDLGQAENRAVAYVANEPNMIKAFETGIDIHSQTAALILGIDISEVTKKERNTIGKPSNHGLNYGLGYRKFALMHKLPESHAKFIVERYHAVYSGVRQWHAIIQGQLRENRTLTNLYGRKRKFLDRWGDELFKQAYDYIPQSTVGTKINLDGIIYTYYNQEWSSPFLFALQVHDSVIYEIPLDLPAQKLADIAWRIKQGLERPLHHRERTFVIPADLALGMNLKDMVELKSHECQTPQVIANLLQEVFHIS